MQRFVHSLKKFFETKTITTLVIVFVLLRVVSLATYHHTAINGSIAAMLVVSYFFVCKKNISTGWMLLLAEILLDGAGHFFEFENLILRTWFLGIFGVLWILKKWQQKKLDLPVSGILLKEMIAVGLVIMWSIVNGFLKHHGAVSILQDAILYFFLVLLFPAFEYQSVTEKRFIPFFRAFIIGSTIFSLVSYIIYTSGFGHLPDTYYHWFRNIAGGKITDLGDNFFRIVLSEHIYIVPFLLVLTSLLIKNPKNKMYWAYVLCSSIILALNFSRIYFVALAAGMLLLAIKNNLKRWFVVSAGITLCVVGCFSTLYFISSRGQSLGLELIGLRIGGATSPKAETSGAIRLAILPDAIATIKKHPLLGSGLATTVTYIDPATQMSVTRTQFDFGYLEVLAELGIVGTIIFLSFLFTILILLAKQAYVPHHREQINIPLLRGLIAGALSLFVMNVTTPALFQGFGILYFVFLLIVLQKTLHKMES